MGLQAKSDKTFAPFTWAKDETIPVDPGDRREASRQLKNLRKIMFRYKEGHPNYDLGNKYVAILSDKVAVARAAYGYAMDKPGCKTLESNNTVDEAAIDIADSKDENRVQNKKFDSIIKQVETLRRDVNATHAKCASGGTSAIGAWDGLDDPLDTPSVGGGSSGDPVAVAAVGGEDEEGASEPSRKREAVEEGASEPSRKRKAVEDGNDCSAVSASKTKA